MKEKINNPLVGVVMCGVNGSRASVDTGLTKEGNITLAEAACQKLQSFTKEVYISINLSQQKVYSEIFSKDKLITDNIALKDPLASLFSAHKNLPDKDMFLLACNMKRIDDESLKNLFHIYKTNKKLYDFFVYKRNVNYETFTGIYTKQGTSRVYNTYLKDTLFKQSINYILETGNTYAIKIRNKNRFGKRKNNTSANENS